MTCLLRSYLPRALRSHTYCAGVGERYRWRLAQKIEAVTITLEFTVRDGLAGVNGYALASTENVHWYHVPGSGRSDVGDQKIDLPCGVAAPEVMAAATDVEAAPMTRGR